MKNMNEYILKERAKIAAKMRAAKEDSASTGKLFIEFLLFPERYAVESCFVREVLTMKEITTLPGVPDYVMGVVNYRSEIISVLNLKILFGLKERGLTEMNKIILLRNNSMEFGLVADAITGSLKVDRQDISEPPLNLSKSGAKYVVGTLENGTIILSADKLLTGKALIVNHKQ